MLADPIVEEVRRARQEYAKQFDYDLHAIAADLRSNAGRFNISYCLWRVANHFDHVHCSVAY